MLKRIRELIHMADREVVEEWKWVKPSSPGVPVWSHEGGICTGEVYKQVVKLTFYQGAALTDPGHLFNSSLGGNTRRAIDIHEDDVINEAAFKALIRPLLLSTSQNGRSRTSTFAARYPPSISVTADALGWKEFRAGT